MYTTNILPLAAYLMTIPEITFVGVDQSNPSRVLFQFQPFDLAKEASENYFSDQALASPRLLEEHKNYLKDIVFDIRRNISPDRSY